MTLQLVIAAFVLGFTGSFHCVGMCGPIAMAMPNQRRSHAARWWSIIKYLSGKTITYTFAGLLAGLLGRQFVISGFQQGLSIVLGVLLLITVGVILFKNNAWHSNFLQRAISNKLIPVFGRLLQNPSGATPFFLGMVNGLLPCGLVYAGLLAATATGSAFSGGWFMMWFGIGTMPVMFSFLALANRFGFSFRQKIKKATPYFIAIAACMLILRGMNLGIPFLSPDFDAARQLGAEAISCHP
ncbi:MAG: sulfite exporter TauE/SafE family protein [Bacteroidota bacterium]